MSEPILPEGLWQRVEPLLPPPKLKRRDILGAGRKPSGAAYPCRFGKAAALTAAFQSAGGGSATDSPIQMAFMSNDRAPFRVAFMAVRGLREDPEQFVHAGLHHLAFEYDSFDDLMSSFARLKQLGIEPIVCVNHGLTTSCTIRIPTRTRSSCRPTISATGTRRLNG